MPPGWTKTVNSACLMDSFAMVDRRKPKVMPRTCQVCEKSLPVVRKERDGSLSGRSRRITNILKKIAEIHPQGEELQSILLLCKHLLNEENRDLADSKLDSSTSPYLFHLLHFTWRELNEMCRPREGLLVSVDDTMNDNYLCITKDYIYDDIEDDLDLEHFKEDGWESIYKDIIDMENSPYRGIHEILDCDSALEFLDCL